VVGHRRTTIASPPRPRAAILTAAFFATASLLLLWAWEWRDVLLPAGWTEFAFSPWAVSVPFAIGVVAYRLSSPAPPEALARIASELGGAGFVVIYALCASSVIYHPVHLALLMALSMALVMIGAQSSSVVNRLLTRPALLYIGTISYSLYLFHFITPGLGFTGRFETFDGGAAAAYALNFLFMLALAIALATGLYRLVEVPGRRAIRAAGDRLLGIRRTPPIVGSQGATAE